MRIWAPYPSRTLLIEYIASLQIGFSNNEDKRSVEVAMPVCYIQCGPVTRLGFLYLRKLENNNT